MNQHEKLDLILSETQDVKADMTYVKGILENNDKTGQKGAVYRLDDLEGRVDKIETKDEVRVGKATLVGGVVGGAIVPGLWWVGKLAVKYFL